jgi:hypothetical protein
LSPVPGGGPGMKGAGHGYELTNDSPRTKETITSMITQ